MTTSDQITKIKQYFNMWITRDFSELDTLFAKNIFYTECIGTVYQGLDEVHRWINHLTPRQYVDQWTIHDVFELPSVCVVTWYFEAHEQQTYAFEGCSIIEFDSQAKISSIREFESKFPKYTPDYVKEKTI